MEIKPKPRQKDLDFRKLDKLYQLTMLEKYNYNSILGGRADLIHHMMHKPNSIRWYTKNAIPLTIRQHNEIHNNKAKEYRDYIIRLKGKAWIEDLGRKKHKIVKYLEEEKIIAHIMGEIEYYA